MKLRLKEELISGKKIYPLEKEIFKAFELTAPENTKVVILGQDPYHNFNQANGLCFSVKEKQLLPPSLKNIFKELEDDLGIKNYKHGDLSSWLVLRLLPVLRAIESRAEGKRENLTAKYWW